jgi:hypothetical protein
MRAMPDPTQSDPKQSAKSENTKPDPAKSGRAQPEPSQAPFSTGRWLVKLPEAAWVDRLAELNADLGKRPPRGRRVLVATARVAVTFCIGVAVTLAWQPYGDAARMIIANASPQLGWLAPQAGYGLASASAGPSPRNAASSDLDTVRDRIDQIATTQEQMTRAVAQLTASQTQIAQEIAKVREVEQYLLYKTSYKGEEAPSAKPVAPPAHAAPAHKTRRPSFAAR